MILAVEKLSVGFRSERGYFSAVNGVSFSVQRGETLGIVGESGSGKSLTALSLLRLTDYLPGCSMEANALQYFPEEGAALDVLSLPSAALRRMRGRDLAIIFQDPSSALNPVFTCGEQLSEVLRAHKGMDRREAREASLAWLERVRLPDVRRMYASFPHQLSGGQKQRVAIAIALAAEPKLLIADEPTTALDAPVQQRILELLRQLREELGMSLLFISHDLGVVSQMADRVLVMQSGEIVEEGSREQVFHQAAHPYTRRLLASRPPIDIRLRRLPVEETDRSQPWDAPSLQARKEALSALPPLLEVEGLSVRYALPRSGIFGKRTYLQAVDRVDLQIAPGETLGVVGESGSGKTSLGKAIIRLVAAQAGTVRLEGQDIMSMPERDWRAMRRRAQIIFQDPYHSLNPRMPVGEAIMEPLEVHRIVAGREERYERAVRWLERVGLEADHFSRYPHELSGGQRQRVGIARALAVEPRLLICDECVSALDVTVQAQILNLLLDLQESQGFSMLFISHDMAVVRFISDRVLVMGEGVK